MHNFVIGAGLAVAVVAIAPVHAESASKNVGFGDLNLSAVSGRAMLRARIRAAANAVCGEADPRDVLAMMDMGRCRRGAIARAELGVQQALAAQHNLQVASRSGDIQ